MSEDDDHAFFERMERYERWKASRVPDRTILDMWTEWIAAQDPEKETTRTRRAWKYWLEIVFSHQGSRICLGNLAFSECTTGVLIAWQAMMTRTPGPRGKILVAGSVDQVRLALQSMFGYFLRTGEIGKNPLYRYGGVDRLKGYDRKTKAYVTKEIVNAVVAHLPLIDGYIFRHTWSTGAREKAIRCLKKTQIDMLAHGVTLTMKGGAERTILVPDREFKEMIRLAELSPSEYVYPNPRDPQGLPIPRATYFEHCDKAYRDAGIKHLSGERPTRRALRHGRAADILKRTGDITLVKRQLGHATLQHTLRYAEKDEVQNKRLLDVLNRDDDTDDE